MATRLIYFQKISRRRDGLHTILGHFPTVGWNDARYAACYTAELAGFVAVVAIGLPRRACRLAQFVEGLQWLLQLTTRTLKKPLKGSTGSWT